MRDQVRRVTRIVRLLGRSRFRSWGIAALRERSNRAAEAQRAAWLKADGAVAKHSIRTLTEKASKDEHADRLLAALVRVRSARRVIELGTNLGLSGTYMAAALPAGGRLFTVDQSVDRQALARHLFESAGLVDRIEVVTGSFREVVDGVAVEGFDVAFVDGDHTFAATCWLVDTLLRHARAGSVIVVDDINHSSQMQRAWRTIASRPDVAPVSLGDLGVIEVLWVG